jgi:hypothetical protein
MTIRWNRFLLTACVALIGISIKTAFADEWNKEMKLRINEPVQVPGRVLEPGNYIFRLADSPSNRNIVQIYSVDQKGRQNFVAMIETISAFRLPRPDKPIVELEERHIGNPEAIKKWFYPGDNYGWEFVYPKSQGLETAEVVPPPAAPAPAPAAEPPAPVEPAEAPATVITESETLIAQVELTPEPVEDEQPQAEQTLPETAGYSTSLLLVGFLAIGAGLFTLSLALRKVKTEAE